MICKNRFKAHILFFMLVTCSISTIIPQEENSHVHKHSRKKRKRKALERWLAALGIGTGIILLGKYGWQGTPRDIQDPEAPNDETGSNPEVTPQNNNAQGPPDEDMPIHEIKAPTAPPAQIPLDEKQFPSTPQTPAVPIEPASFKNALALAIQINDAKLVNQVLSQYKELFQQTALSQYEVSNKTIADSLISYLSTREKTISQSGITFNREIADALYSKSHQAYFKSKVKQLVTDICDTTHDKKVVDWVQSKIGDGEMENVASDLFYRLSGTGLVQMLTQHSQLTTTFLQHNDLDKRKFIEKFNPNPFKAFKPLQKHNEKDICAKDICAMDGKYRDKKSKYATQYLLDNYANPQLEEELTSLAILSNDPVKIITSYLINDTCEPGAMRYIIHLLENRAYMDEDTKSINALKPRFAYYKDKEKQNLLPYAFELEKLRDMYIAKNDILTTLLISGVDYTDCQGDDAESIVSILDQFDCNTLKRTYQPLLYATYRAAQTLYIPEEEDTEEGKTGHKYLSIVKELLQNTLLQNTMGTAHDKNNLSVFDYAGGNTKVLDALVPYVHPDTQDSKKNTIFHRLASGAKMPKFFQHLESKRKPSRPHMSYDSVFALIQDHPNLINPHIENNAGLTALQVLEKHQLPDDSSAQHAHTRIVEFLTLRKAALAATPS